MYKAFIVSFIFSFIVLASTTSHAQTIDPDNLEVLAAEQKRAETEAEELSGAQQKILTEINALQEDLVNQGSKARGFERALTKARKNLAALSARETKLSAKILQDQVVLGDMLAALQRIDARPPPALLVHPNDATDAARAAHLLAYLSQDLDKKSKVLQTQLIDLQDLRAKMGVSRAEIVTQAGEVNRRLGRIKSTISDKSALNDKIDTNRKVKVQKANQLAKQAKDLRELIARFEDNAADINPRLKPSRGSRGPTPRLKPNVNTNQGSAATPRYIPPAFTPSGSERFSDARGQIPLPVFGSLSRNYGARLAGGGVAKGISLRSTYGASVIAPFGGRVEFSGAFNDDHVVILNVGDGYFIVLTGLGEVFTEAGIYVKAGEPLGLMPKKLGQIGKTSKTPELFMEFRQNRSSINPKPWIGAALAKSG